MNAVISTLSPQNLADRMKGVGGSDVAAALGISRYKTALQLYLEKTGELAPDDLSDNETVEWGIRHEPTVRQKYAEAVGQAVELPKDTIWHPTVPHMFVHPDGFVRETRRIYSGKYTDLRFGSKEAGYAGWGEPGTSDIPLEYYFQSQQELCVMQARAKEFGIEIEAVDYGVLFAGSRFRIYTVFPDAEVQAGIIDGVNEFWQRVTTKNAPPPDFNAKSTFALIKKMFPGTNGETILANAQQEAYRVTMEDAAERAKLYEGIKDATKAALLFDMGEAAQLQFADGASLTRSKIDRKGFTVEPTSYIDARMKAAPKAKKGKE